MILKISETVSNAKIVFGESDLNFTLNCLHFYRTNILKEYINPPLPVPRLVTSHLKYSVNTGFMITDREHTRTPEIFNLR